MKFLSLAKSITKKITARLKRDNIAEYSAYSALYIVLSFVPIILIFLNIIKKTDIVSFLVKYDINILSGDVSEFIENLFEEVNEKSNGVILSFSTVSALWLSSRALIGIINGLNRINKTPETRGYFRIRIYAILAIAVMFTVLTITLFLLVFGAGISEIATELFPALSLFSGFTGWLRWIVGLIILVLFFMGTYSFLPINKGNSFSKLPGAVFSSLGWLVFSAIYSLYIENFADYSYLYGSLSVIVLLILWLYICMYILFLGEELNRFIYEKRILRKDNL